jgi:hypothetical protein
VYQFLVQIDKLSAENTELQMMNKAMEEKIPLLESEVKRLMLDLADANQSDSSSPKK